MTEQEAIGEVGKELADAKRRRACLFRRATNYQRQIATVSEMLRGISGEFVSALDATDMNQREWPSYEQITALCSEIDDVETRIEECEARLRDLGVI